MALYNTAKDEAKRLLELIKGQLELDDAADKTTMLFMQNVAYGAVQLGGDYPGNGKRLLWFHVRDISIKEIPIDYWVTGDPTDDDDFYIVDFHELQK